MVLTNEIVGPDRHGDDVEDFMALILCPRYLRRRLWVKLLGDDTSGYLVGPVQADDLSRATCALGAERRAVGEESTGGALEK